MGNINRHHLFYEKRCYKKSLALRALRESHGLIIPVRVVDHRGLHRAVDRRDGKFPSVPMPDLESARYFVSDVMTPYSPEQATLYTLEQAIGWFAVSGDEATAEHLQWQHDFLDVLEPIPAQAAINLMAA